MVDGTNINYPIVQTTDNDFYLNHNILKRYSTDGWTFLDFRNNSVNDKNTIFYGHNMCWNNFYIFIFACLETKKE